MRFLFHEDVDLSELDAAADVRCHAVYYDDGVAKGVQGTPSVINGKNAFPGGNSPGVT